MSLNKSITKSTIFKFILGVMMIAAVTVESKSYADNPIIQTRFTADPAPMVYHDTVYLYADHDEDSSTWFTMKNWYLYTSTDMVNWTDHGVVASLKSFSWAPTNGAWAPQCIERNGKFFMYCPIHMHGIGVLVSNSPYGPFVDPLGKPLIFSGFGDIDPTVYIDSDGQAYLYWGNPNLYYVKLNNDMISYDQKVGIVKVPLTDKSFKLRIINAKQTFAWAKSINGLASQTIRNDADNKYYWYVSAIDKYTNNKVIGVAVGNDAIGPFTDLLGKPLITQHCGEGNINPTVVIDNTKQAYLTWGNSDLWYVKLNNDMMSYDANFGIQPISGAKNDWVVSEIRKAINSTGKRYTTYEEGPWFYKRNGLYYMVYSAGGVPEHIAYSTSTGPTGHWIYRDTIMSVIKEGGAFTNHSGIINFKGHSYFFYHDGDLPGGGGFDRSICIEPFKYNSDGTIPRITPTKAGVVKGVAHLNPYIRQAASTIAWEVGVKTSSNKNIGVYVTSIENEDYIKVRSVDFAKGAKLFEANIASGSKGGIIEIHLDSLSGTLLGVCLVKNSSGWQNWTIQSCNVKTEKGIHDLYFLFKGGQGNLFNFKWWKFE
jgi:beta-xylosidase